jgi:hypothetical protein
MQLRAVNPQRLLGEGEASPPPQLRAVNPQRLLGEGEALPPPQLRAVNLQMFLGEGGESSPLQLRAEEDCQSFLGEGEFCLQPCLAQKEEWKVIHILSNSNKQQNEILHHF